EAAAQARKRLDDETDTEALHDLRVALRRLRSCVRAYKPYLEDSVSKKLRNRLRELAAATTTARDTEVQMAWLSGQRPRLTARQRGGLRWMLGWLEQKHSAAYADVRGEVAADFEKLYQSLTRRLAVYTTEVRVGEPHRLRGFADVTAELLRRH